MKESVIIPSYNPSDYLWECVNSYELQSILIVNDSHIKVVFIGTGL